MYQRCQQCAVLQIVAILAIITVAIDSLVESQLLQQLSHNVVQFLPGWRPSGGPVDRLISNTTGWSVYENQGARYCQIPIDHNDSSAGYFSNRYWVNDEFYKPDGPVFVHDTGESNAESAMQMYLFKPDSHLQRLLRDFSGVGIVWEHRYYGQSFPSSATGESHYDRLRTLSFEQALADLPYFSQSFSLPNHQGVDLTPLHTPWIIMGCSYSGLRAAASRLLYPGTFFAAYAASAPVQLQVELSTFFDAVYTKMVDRGYRDCAADLHIITMYIDRLLSDPKSADLVKRSLLGPGAEQNGNSDFALAVANIFSYFQTHGLAGGSNSLNQLCAYLESHEDHSVQGFGDEELFQLFASWPGLKRVVNDHFNTSCGNNDSLANCDLARVSTDPSDISWSWQMCSELGLFVTQNAGPFSLVSRFMSLGWRLNLCKRQFSEMYVARQLSEVPSTDKINRMTGGLLMRPSNTFWTAGQYDPWRTLTPFLRDEDKNVSVFSITEKIPKYNEGTGVGAVFGHLLQDAQHCYDWSVEHADSEKARALFSQALRQWLALQ